MSTKQAEIIDLSLSAFRRQRKLESLPRAESESLMLDMGDTIVVASLMLGFAGFTWAEGALFLIVMAMVGDGEAAVSLYDEEVADVANCSPRTVRRWRKGYSEKARGIVGSPLGTKRYSPMEIREGEYDPKIQRYQPTRYFVSIMPLLETAVAVARAMQEYRTDRLKALRKTAELHYDGIPDAPYRERKRRPSRSMKAAVPALISNARRNIERAGIAFDDLNDFARDDLVEAQGDVLRSVLLEIQAKIAELLEAMPQPTENKEHKGGIGHNVRYPSDTWDRYVSLLMKDHCKGLRVISNASVSMSRKEVDFCRKGLREMGKELVGDPELWDAYLLEAAEIQKTGKMPTHRNAKERAYLLSCIGGKLV